MKLIRSFAVAALLVIPSLASAQNYGVEYSKGRFETGTIMESATLTRTEKSDLFGLGSANGSIEYGITLGGLAADVDGRDFADYDDYFYGARVRYAQPIGRLPFGLSLTKQMGLGVVRFEQYDQFRLDIAADMGLGLGLPIDIAESISVTPFATPSLQYYGQKHQGISNVNEQLDAALETGLNVAIRNLSIGAKARLGDERFSEKQQLIVRAGFTF